MTHIIHSYYQWLCSTRKVSITQEIYSLSSDCSVELLTLGFDMISLLSNEVSLSLMENDSLGYS